MIYDAIIIGGGISGLVAAYQLAKKGKNILLLEKGNVVGGNIRTVRDGNYLLELGPNTLRNEYLELEALIIELGLQNDILIPAETAKKSYIAIRGKLHEIPSSLSSALTTPLLSIGGKLSMVREPFVKARSGDETVAVFFGRRFGKEFTRTFVAPMVSGIFAGDVDTLSMGSAFPKIKALEEEYGSLTKGILKSRGKKEESKSILPKIFSFQNGLATLPQALAKKLGANIRYGMTCLDIRKEDFHFAVETEKETFETKNVILATPARITADLISSIDDPLSKSLFQIPYPPVIVVHFAYKRSEIRHSLDGFGFLVTSCEDRDVLGCVFSSSVFPPHAPADEALFTIIMGGATHPEVIEQSDDEIVNSAKNAISKYLRTDEPIYSHITRLPHAIPQYSLGHEKIMAEIRRAEKEHQGLYFLANYRGGISVWSCIKNAVELAERL